MSEVFFLQMDILKPDYNLGEVGFNHGGNDRGMIEKVLLTEKPDRVLVDGDTNSTLAGALATGKLYTPCGSGLTQF